MRHYILPLAILLSTVGILYSQVSVDTGYLLFGLETIPDTVLQSKGTLFFFDKKSQSFRGGEIDGLSDTVTYYDPNNSDFGVISFGFGRNVKASAYSTAFGNSAEAQGYSSTAFGSYSKAEGRHSIAAGSDTKAIGTHSVALGVRSKANAPQSLALGNNLIANGWSSMVVGLWNDSIVSPYPNFGNTPVDLKSPIFIVGNGGNNDLRHNAFEIRLDGSAMFYPDSTSRYLIIDHITNPFGQYEPIIRPSEDNWGYLGSPDHEFYRVYTEELFVNEMMVTSDISVKSNISNIEPGMELLKRLRPVNYDMKNAKNSKSHYGLIAQEVQEVLPDLVRKKGSDLLAVNYLEIIPILIKGIQEQQEMIEKLLHENTRINERLHLIEQN